jgi:phosphatidylglycerophosphate synthase
MNSVDVVLVVMALLAAYQGARVGAVVQVCAIVGFFGGLYLGALLASVTVRWAASPTAKTAVALTTMVGGCSGTGSSCRSTRAWPDRSTPGSAQWSPW